MRAEDPMDEDVKILAWQLWVAGGFGLPGCKCLEDLSVNLRRQFCDMARFILGRYVGK